MSLHIASAGLGEGSWLSAQTQLEMSGVRREDQVPWSVLCRADPETGQGPAYWMKEPRMLQKPLATRPVPEQLTGSEPCSSTMRIDRYLSFRSGCEHDVAHSSLS